MFVLYMISLGINNIRNTFLNIKFSKIQEGKKNKNKKH